MKQHASFSRSENEKKRSGMLSVPVMAVFLVVFTLALFFVNYYVFVRLLAVATVSQAGWILPAVLSGISAILFVLSTFLAKGRGGALLVLVYSASSYWLGLIVFTFPLMVLSDIFGVFFPGSLRTFYLLSFTAAFILAAFSSFRAERIKVREITLDLGFEMTIVQVSDVHFGILHPEKFLENMVKNINSLGPDMVCFTGDLIDDTLSLREDTLSPLKELKAPAFFVSGNHEMFFGLDELLPALEKAGVRVLDSGEAEVKGVRVLGMGFTFDKKRPFEALRAILPGEWPSVLLIHEPLGAEIAAEKGVSLMLSGHTHAGQVIPFNLLVRLSYRFTGGLYKVGNMYLNVSTGYGTWGPRMRLGSASELNVIRARMRT